jgi:Zn-dependent protease with chaperone function
VTARIWLLVFVLGAPILGVTVSRLGDPNLENDGLATLGRVSMTTGVAGLLVLGAITIGGYRARSSRETLLALFRPGLYAIAIFVCALIVVHAGILLGTLFLGLERAPGLLVISILLGAGTGVIAVSRAAFGRVVRSAESSVFGQPLTSEAAGDLWKLTSGIADRLGALRPDNIVVGLDPNFFVTEAIVHTPHGSLSGRTLFCSLPLSRIMTVDELSAIIGHELGHFRGEDLKWSEKFGPIYRGSADAIALLQHAGDKRGWGALVLLPAIGMFGFFLERFAIAESEHSRSRELLADKAGAEATSARAMAVALVKVHAFSSEWSATVEGTVHELQQQRLRPNLSVSFAETTLARASAESLRGIAETSTSHPIDTHPPLAVRLASLEVELQSVANDSLAVGPETSAATLIPGREKYEERLSQSYQEMIAASLGINLQRPAGASPIRACASCGTKVLPTSDGHCPSCGALMAR